MSRYSSFSPFQSIFDNPNHSKSNVSTNISTLNDRIKNDTNTDISYVQLTNTGNRCYVCGWTTIYTGTNSDDIDDDGIRRLHDYHQLCQLKENLRDEYTNSTPISNSIRKEIIELQVTIYKLEETIETLTNDINDGNILLTSHHFTKLRKENQYDTVYDNNIKTNSIIEMKTLIIEEVMLFINLFLLVTLMIIIIIIILVKKRHYCQY